jgi:hypothetical protein
VWTTFLTSVHNSCRFYVLSISCTGAIALNAMAPSLQR